MTSTNAETCSITGSEANARFDGGTGVAWYGSSHDLDLMVDLSGMLSGPVCDDELSAAKAGGVVVTYGDQVKGLYPLSRIGDAAARRLFELGAAAQVKAVSERPEPRRIRSVRSGNMVLRIDEEITAPAWQAPVGSLAHVLHPSGSSDAAEDFQNLGALWALGELAADRDGLDARAAAVETVAFVGSLAVARRQADDARDGFAEAIAASFDPAPTVDFTVVVALAEDTDFGSACDAAYQGGIDATMSLQGGRVLVDFSRTGELATAVAFALRDVASCIPGSRVKGVEFPA